ncbi:MAG: hypothetical protein P8099_08480, partial [Gemmatimonadota bacterium]
MRFGIPLLDQRVAPRCTIADSVLLITLKRRRILGQSTVGLDHATWMDLARLLAEEAVDTLVCGGISRANRETMLSYDVDVIDNVAGTAQEVVEALRRGGLTSGFGLGVQESGTAGGAPGDARRDGDAGDAGEGTEPWFTADSPTEATAAIEIDCLACAGRPCLRGAACPLVGIRELAVDTPEAMLEAAWDVACEDERMLCRLAELVYFALEMGYAKL